MPVSGGYRSLGVPLIRAAARLPPTARCVGTLVCASLRGHDTPCARFPPHARAALLRDHLALLTDVVEEFGGQVLNIADGNLMAAFGLADARHSHVREAVAAARTMQRRFTALRASWRERGGIEAGLGVAVHRGEVDVSLFGSASEPTPVIVGEAANLAGAMSRRARAGEILLSGAVQAPQAGIPPHDAGAPLIALARLSLRSDAAPLDLWCVPLRERLTVGAIPAATPADS